MNIEKVEGFIIYVNDIDEGRKFWGDFLGVEFSEPFENTAAGTIGSVARNVLGIECIELVEGIPGGSVHKAVQKKGEGLGGIFLKVPDMDEALADAKRQGIRVISATAGRIMVTLLHPKDTHGVFIDLHTDEDKKPAHIDPKKYKPYTLVQVTDETRRKGDVFTYKEDK
jgi:catechol 2,3-dioxygenase-like lactoylglutathione lyase family enzyme